MLGTCLKFQKEHLMLIMDWKNNAYRCVVLIKSHYKNDKRIMLITKWIPNMQQVDNDSKTTLIPERKLLNNSNYSNTGNMQQVDIGSKTILIVEWKLLKQQQSL